MAENVPFSILSDDELYDLFRPNINITNNDLNSSHFGNLASQGINNLATDLTKIMITIIQVLTT